MGGGGGQGLAGWVGTAARMVMALPRPLHFLKYSNLLGAELFDGPDSWRHIGVRTPGPACAPEPPAASA